MHLVLGSTGVTDVAPLSSLVNLVELDLGSTGVTDFAPLSSLNLLEN
jgi:hypothetical protein